MFLEGHGREHQSQRLCGGLVGIIVLHTDGPSRFGVVDRTVSLDQLPLSISQLVNSQSVINQPISQ